MFPKHFNRFHVCPEMVQSAIGRPFWRACWFSQSVLHRVIHSLLCGYSVQTDRLFPPRYGQKSCDVRIRLIERVTVGKADRFFRQSFSDHQSAPPFHLGRYRRGENSSLLARANLSCATWGRSLISADTSALMPMSCLYPVPHLTKCCRSSLHRQLQSREGDKFLPGPAFFISG